MSHPHENISEECEELTVEAREKYLERIQECNHNFVHKMDSWCLICKNYCIAERSPKVLNKQNDSNEGII